MLKPSVKLWLKKGDTSVIGEGRAQLLRKVEELGSISKAASAMKMSYRHAWGIIRQITDSVDKEIVETIRGGRSGGGARLTIYGKKILKQYEDNAAEIKKLLKYGPRSSLAVDGVIFDRDNNLIMIHRKNPPYKGKLALPGGFVDYNETTENAVLREIREELGVKTKIKRLIGVYSEPERDPRHHIISVVYELEPLEDTFKAGDDAADFIRISINDFSKMNIEDIAFDHGQIITTVIADLKKRFK